MSTRRSEHLLTANTCENIRSKGSTLREDKLVLRPHQRLQADCVILQNKARMAYELLEQQF